MRSVTDSAADLTLEEAGWLEIQVAPLTINFFADLYANQGALWVSVMHGKFHGPAETLANLLRPRLDVGKIEILRILPVLGVHTGPGIMGAAVMPLHLVEDIA